MRFDVPKLADYSGAIQANQSMANAFSNLGNQSQDYLKMEEQKKNNEWNRAFDVQKFDLETNKYNSGLQEKADAKSANAGTLKALYPTEYGNLSNTMGNNPNLLGNVDIGNVQSYNTNIAKAAKEKEDALYQAGRDKISDGFERDRISISRQNANEPKYEFKETDNGFVAINKSNPSAPPIAISGAFKTPDQNKETFKQEKELRDEYTKKASNYTDAKSNFARLNAANDNAVGDLSLIFSYMKMLDPQSVVREGEFATAQNTVGIDGRIVNAYNKTLNGERLNPEQRLAFKKQAEDLYKTTIADEKKLRDTISIVADYHKIDKRNIFGNDSVTTDNNQSETSNTKKSWREWDTEGKK